MRTLTRLGFLYVLFSSIPVRATVPDGRKDGKLSLKVANPLGDRDSDSIKLKCAAAP